MPVNVRKKDLGIARLQESLARMKKLRVTIDFGGHKHPQSGLAMAHHAAIHEYGTQNIPARPALQHAVDESQEELAAASADVVHEVIRNATDPVDAMLLVAKLFHERVVESYESARDWATPLKPQTIKRKGHDKPLDETHALIDAVGWAIRESGRFRRRGK